MAQQPSAGGPMRVIGRRGPNIDAVERVTGRKVAWRPAPRRPGDPAVLYASARRIRADLGWVPRRADLDVIVGDAWRWHQNHPDGFGDRGRSGSQ